MLYVSSLRYKKGKYNKWKGLTIEVSPASRAAKVKNPSPLRRYNDIWLNNTAPPTSYVSKGEDGGRKHVHILLRQEANFKFRNVRDAFAMELHGHKRESVFSVSECHYFDIKMSKFKFKFKFKPESLIKWPLTYSRDWWGWYLLLCVKAHSKQQHKPIACPFHVSAC